jgi:hypothetical protein
VDASKNSWFLNAAGTGNDNTDVLQVLPLFFKEHNNIDARARAYGRQQELHRTHPCILTARGKAGVGFDRSAVFVRCLEMEGVVEAV